MKKAAKSNLGFIFLGLFVLVFGILDFMYDDKVFGGCAIAFGLLGLVGGIYGLVKKEKFD